MQENNPGRGGARPKRPSGTSHQHTGKPRADGNRDRRILSTDNLIDRTDEINVNRHHQHHKKKDTRNKHSAGKKNQNKIAELKALVADNPDRYKRCVIGIDDKGAFYAKIIYQCTSAIQDKITRVSISGTENRGHCFRDDEVVVEILNKRNKVSKEEEADDCDAALDDSLPNGKVIGVLQSANDLDNWIILCTADENNSDLLRPIDRSLPALSNYKTADCKEGKIGHVAVFKYTSLQKIDFLKYCPVVSDSAMPQIFCVRYLWWKDQDRMPLGAVIGVLSNEEPLKRSMIILSLENQNPVNFHDDSYKEIDLCFPESFEISREELGVRLNFTKAMTFTIDPPDSKDFDDALSVTELADGQNCVGVHIADVSYFVKPKSALDNESRKRGTSIYEIGGKEPISMLPARLSADLCSLQEGKERLTLSVFMTTDANDDIVKVELKKSVIKSQFRLNYYQVQEVFMDSHSFNSKLPSDLQKVLVLLNRISQRWRKGRVGHVEFSRQTNNLDYVLTPIAHRIVEEMMIMANHQVAQLLLGNQHFFDCTPLVVHRVPDRPEIEDWRRRFPNEASIIEMVQPLHEKDNPGSAVANDFIEKNKKFVIHKQVWREMVRCVETGEWERLQSLILSSEYHPGLIVAWFNLPSFTKRSTYVCSGDHITKNHWHFSLNLPCYTQFTSPIRRYIDLLVHRLVHSSIDGLQGTSCYHQSEISEMCVENQSIKTKVGIYESSAKNIHFAEFLRVKPLSINALVDRVTATGFKLNCLQLSAYLKLWPLDISLLGARQATAVRNHRRGKVILTYALRIYDLDSLSGPKPESSQVDEGPVKLNSRRNVFYASLASWKELVLSALEGDKDRIKLSLDGVTKGLEDPEKAMSSGFIEDVSCEGTVLQSGRCSIDFTTAVTAGDIVQLQVAGEAVRGKLNPFVQLFSLSPTVDVCLEHRANPGKCFAQLSIIQNSALFGRRDNIESYCRFWCSLVVMETVERAVARSDCVLLQNVGVSWLDSETGHLQISVEFCRERNIGIFDDLVKERDSERDAGKSGFLGLMCLRHRGVTKPPPDTELPIGNVIDLNVAFTWVGHCVATDVTRNENNFSVRFNLNQSSCSVPEQMGRDFKSQKATLEWISLTQSERGTIKTLQRLPDMYASSFAASLALSSTQPPKLKNLDREHFEINRKCLDKIRSKIRGSFDKEQESLILETFRQPFSLIHGYTSSGKTVMAAQLAYRITQVNRIRTRDSGVKCQVMCCGPTEGSLLSLAEHLHSKELELSVVFVYDRQEERKDFPLPEDLSFKSRSLVGEDNGLRQSLGLHHLIRSTNSTDGELMREIDNTIDTQPKDVSFHDLLKYKSAIENEESKIIKSADIILCLCVTSVEKRIKKNANIKQVIIDDGQACTEPETLLPLVHGSVCQVIICGDIKQIKPTIISSVTRKYGLGHSLFERCLSESTALLTKQYTMHPALLGLLTPVFYDEKALKRNAVNELPEPGLDFWPFGAHKPFMFLDIVGTESQSPHMNDGSAPDIFNMDEVNATVQICKWLVQKISPEQNICVLSCYEMHCMKIKKQLKDLANVTVATVNSVLGRHWDYVIVSSVRSLPLSDIKQKPDKKWLHSSLGCLCSKNICCTLLSRAYEGLIIIGNKSLLQCDDSWKQLVQHFHKNRSIVDLAGFVANHLK